MHLDEVETALYAFLDYLKKLGFPSQSGSAIEEVTLPWASDRSNPDVLLTFEGQPLSSACKTVTSTQLRTYADRVRESWLGVRSEGQMAPQRALRSEEHTS